MKILLLSAYDAASHKHWRQTLQKNMGQHQWHVLALPPRYFNWRIRGNSLTWAFDSDLDCVTDYDCLIATFMTDLSALRGMRPNLCLLPTLLYFHENQFAYPKSKDLDNPAETQRIEIQRIEPQIVQLYSSICADKLIFNSRFNRDTFLSGVEELLKKMPDCIPKGVCESLKAKSQCLAVPLTESFFAMVNTRQRGKNRSLQIVWNHRWEYDKGPELLADCIASLPPSLALCFHVVGQRFRTTPKAFERIYELLVARKWLGEWGFVASNSEYRSLLARSDIVLSTADHDFQGLSVLEAVALGCVPLVPNRVVYPEWFSGNFLYAVDGDVKQNLCNKLVSLERQYSSGTFPSAPTLELFRWCQLQSGYDEVLFELIKPNSKMDP